MPAKRIVCFFIVLLFLSTLTCSVGASSDPTVTFRGAGVTIDLTYPEEAHPEDSITHNVTITANTDLDSVSVALFIYAPVVPCQKKIVFQPARSDLRLNKQMEHYTAI
jgi:hypothetical protein